MASTPMASPMASTHVIIAFGPWSPVAVAQHWIIRHQDAHHETENLETFDCRHRITDFWPGCWLGVDDGRSVSYGSDCAASDVWDFARYSADDFADAQLVVRQRHSNSRRRSLWRGWIIPHFICADQSFFWSQNVMPETALEPTATAPSAYAALRRDRRVFG